MENKKQNPADAIELLHHVEGLITLGENRANIIAAGNAALLVGYSSTNLLTLMFPKSQLFGQLWPYAFALIAVVFAVASLFPQLKSTNLSGRMNPHSYFFGCVGDMTEEVFINDYLKRNEQQHVEMILRAVHMRSKKAKQKFTFLTIATGATVLQFIPIFGTLLQ